MLILLLARAGLQGPLLLDPGGFQGVSQGRHGGLELRELLGTGSQGLLDRRVLLGLSGRQGIAQRRDRGLELLRLLCASRRGLPQVSLASLRLGIQGLALRRQGQLQLPDLGLQGRHLRHVGIDFGQRLRRRRGRTLSQRRTRGFHRADG